MRRIALVLLVVAFLVAGCGKDYGKGGGGGGKSTPTKTGGSGY